MAEHDESVEGMTDKKWQYERAQGTLITLEVRPRPGIEDPWLVASLKLKGELPISKDLHTGEELTVQVAGPDGEVIASGLFEVGLPAFKDIKAKGAGIIGTERAHSAKFMIDQ